MRVKEILVPGDRAHKNRQQVLNRGWFEIDKKVFKKITDLLNE